MSEPSLQTSSLVEETLLVEIDSLIIGRPLQGALYNDRGVLLLAEGQTITWEFKQKLRQCNIQQIRLHREDANRMLLTETENQPGNGVIFDSELTRKLDALIDSSSLVVSNTGPAVKTRMPLCGCRGYDPVHRAEMLKRHQEVSEKLNQLINLAVRGKQVHGEMLAVEVAEYLNSLIEDADNVLTTGGHVTLDQQFAQHCLQVSLLGMALGIELGLDAENLKQLGIIALVQDWGMQKVPGEIREKPDRLTAEEYLEVQKHTIYSLEMLEHVLGLPSLAPLVAYQIHEQPNGRGYPRGKQKTSIHQFAKILRVADVYVALTSPRPFRRPLMPYSAMECMLKLAQREQIEPKITRALLNVLGLFPIGSWVTLGDGSVAQVLRCNQGDYHQPIVQIRQDAYGERKSGVNADIVDLTVYSQQIVQALPTPGKREITLTDFILNHHPR